MHKPEVVFFGSGPVAAQSLALLAKEFAVVAVVTKPKPSHHRGDFPVITLSKELGIPTHTVSNKKELSELIQAKPFATEAAILIDFGIIVAQDVIDYFPKGVINSHFSLLPEWRGADPITFAILSGQQKTGVSLMLLVEAMDEGPLIACGVHELGGTETTPELTDRLVKLSDALLKKEVPRWLAGETKGINQLKMAELISDYPHEPSYSRKLTKEDGILDFNKPAEVLGREIRAFVEWPKSRTKLAGIDVIITSTSVIDQSGEPGMFRLENGELLIYCNEKSLRIEQLKPAGKKEMTAKEFIAGYGQRLQG